MSKLEYLGRHTTIGLLKRPEWRGIPYLRENNGLLPPLVIAVGDARRAVRAVQVLGLKDTVPLHEHGQRLLGLVGRGRVDIFIGLFELKKKAVPLLIVETQMGMPATEIILREVIAHSSPGYKFAGGTIDAGGIYIIRAGTAGGINMPDGNGTKIGIGDIVNAEFSIGWSGSLVESMAGLEFFSDDVRRRFKKRWDGLGLLWTKDGRFPLAPCSKKVFEAVNKAGRGLGTKIAGGGNFSKDSLYAEIDAEQFIELRKRYNVISTEMEQTALLKLCAEYRKAGASVHGGLVSGVIGVLPDSFAKGKDFEERMRRVEEETLKLAAGALWHIARG
jgi:uridine phosphorylase